MRRGTDHDGQRGAALIIVLLLIATLSFILLSITGKVTASIQRSASDRARSELFWRAAAAEVIARRAIVRADEAGALKSTAPDAGLFGEALTLPFENGEGALVFRDATRCFNVNALASGGAKQQSEVDRFIAFAVALGLGDGEAQRLASVIVDFLDADSQEEIQGAEDGFYTALPTPFRTAGGPIADVSELRAMDSVSRERFHRIRPFLCAHEEAQPAPVNLNMLTQADAPLIHAMTNGKWALSSVRDRIQQRPPGGWSDADEFWRPFVAEGGVQPTPPGALTSARIEALVRLEVNHQTMEETLLFEVSPGAAPKLVSRAFGEVH